MKERFVQQYGEEYANQIVAPPGRSEHHTGLAIDLSIKIDGQYDKNNNEINKHIKNYQAIVPYLSQYGFILRYPEDKEDKTKIAYESWHWRYVGEENAKRMNELNMCLEEYVEYLQKGNK